MLKRGKWMSTAGGQEGAGQIGKLGRFEASGPGVGRGTGKVN